MLLTFKIAFALFRATDHALDRVAGAQAELSDLRRRDVNVVGTGEIIRVGRPQEAEAVLQHFDDADADDFDVATRELFQNCEEELLLAQERGVLDFMLFGKSEELGSGLGLQVRKFNFPHSGGTLGITGAQMETSRREEVWRGRRPSGSAGENPAMPLQADTGLRGIGFT
jgi:hypothetical protein